MIELRIDRIVLEGITLDPRHARVVREALEAELTRLATAAPGHWPESRQERQVSAPTIPADADPTALGENVARSVYRSIQGQRGRS